MEYAEDQYPRFTERWSYGAGDVKAVRIPLKGFISREAEGGLFSPVYDPVAGVIRQIRAAENDPQVHALILEVDTPGGGITPSDEIYNALLQFRQSREDRRIVVYMMDVAASGGYMISMAGDWLIAEPTSIIGSIGVILQTLNWKTLSEKVGVTDVTFKSGETKDILNPFREVSEEERVMMQSVVDDLYQHFFDIVCKGRNLDADTLAPLAEGQVFTAQNALEHGLIDQIGYWKDVRHAVRNLLDRKKVRIVRYESQEPFFNRMFSAAASGLQRVPRAWMKPQLYTR
jgi:protease-4